MKWGKKITKSPEHTRLLIEVVMQNELNPPSDKILVGLGI